MRFARLSVLFILVSGSTFAACGGDDGGGGGGGNVDAPQVVDAPMIDAPPMTTNALGQLCPTAMGGGGTACPAGNACTSLMGVGTNMNTGYCSPNCMNMTAVCTTGYTGPAGGQPQCALSLSMGTPPSLCAIVCTATTQCPTRLTCTPVPNQNVMVCVAT